VRRVIVALLAALVAAGLVAPGALAAPASTHVAKVVLIVGPAGGATDRYRAEARAAAKLARSFTPDVTEIYSPNATWLAVKEALQGASVVVYMGHGNGWPSRYRDELYPPSQNGFGLNPAAGSGDGTHQYFGESRIAESIDLAPNAVVLLNHLCYASGNSEPGLPEGTLATARQRVDNFAAGFAASGAAAVIAEAHASPNHMLRAVLRGRGSIESAWRRAPTANGNVFGFESSRTAGYVAEMDPDHGDSGFTRSIVLKRGLASADVLRHAQGRVGGRSIEAAALAPSIASAGLAMKTPLLRSTIAGGNIWYRIPYAIKDRDRLPDGVQASVRWDPLDPVAPDPTAPASNETDTPPDFGLVTAERIGDVVAPTSMKVDRKYMSVRVVSPKTPGRYRLSVMLHDKDGVAFDAASQAMVSALIVRLTGPHDAVVIAPASVEIAPGAAHKMTLWITNVGSSPWGAEAELGTRTGEDSRKPSGSVSATHARVVGTWIPLGAGSQVEVDAAAAASVRPSELPAGFMPRSVTKVDIRMFAPSAPGDYLLLLDIVTPQIGSLAAQGVDPTIVRVRVAEPSAEPAADPAAGASDPVAASDGT
jgi:hypothetical protein